MALDLKKDSAWWYARVRLNGKLKQFNLNIRVAGKRPASISQPGDAAFERSRGQAMTAHEALISDLKTRGNSEELAQRILQAKTGSRRESVPVAQLVEAWERLPRPSAPSPGHLKMQVSTLRRFAAYLIEHHPGLHDLLDVTPSAVAGFLTAEEARGITARTWNWAASLLRAMFRRLEPHSEAYKSYLSGLRGKRENSIHREPFTDEELKRLLTAAQGDELMRPLIVTALYTAQRKGDCACLEWSAVNLNEGFIKTRAQKTGEWVEIPIAPALRKELNAQPRVRGSPYVFPEAQALYRSQPDALDNRLAVLFAQAGVGADGAEKDAPAASPTLPVLPPEELRARLASALAKADITASRRTRVERIISAYLAGASVPAVAQELRLSRSTVFSNLEWMQEQAGVAVLRKASRTSASKARRAVQSPGSTRRLKRASLKGFHSFRTTFITHALNNGMPEQLLRRITGHSSVDIVLKHYYRPRREDLRRAFEMSVRFDA